MRGTCGWCGGEVQDRTPGRGWLKWWHDACAEEKAVIEQPDSARRALLERDKGICCDCGEDWSDRFRLIPDGYVGKWWVERALERPEHYTTGPDGKRLVQLSYSDKAPYVSLTSISLWHADHKIPLWKVAHMPDLQRIEYFKLQNLVTRCHRCHERKTSEEAADRARFDGLAAPKLSKKPKRAWASRSFQSQKRPWPKRSMRGK